MPIHDWSRVFPGTFHDFHSSWITHIKEALNADVLPPDYFALAEQQAASVIPDVLTLSTAEAATENPSTSAGEHAGMLAVAEAPPQVSLHMTADEGSYYRLARRTLTIRHRSSRRVVAMIEILSPGNKDSRQHFAQFVDKAVSAIGHGIHLMAIDLFAPSTFDPQGIHGAIWEVVGGNGFDMPTDKPLTLASYAAEAIPQAYIEALAIGDHLLAMPLFLETGRYIPIPLEETYARAYRGVPNVIKEIVEGRADSETG